MGARLLGAGVAIVVAAAALWFWLSGKPAGDVVPTEFRGVWLNQGAECDDRRAQARIAGADISYGRLVFRPDALAERNGDTISLTGDSFAQGEGARGTVKLQLTDHRTRLIITSSDLPAPAILTRCASAGKS